MTKKKKLKIYICVKKQVLAGFFVGSLFAGVYYAVGSLFIWKHFPRITRWKISRWLLIRDSSHIRDVIRHDYENATKSS